MNNLGEIMTEWQNNLQFREAFKKNPELAIREAGFNLAPEDMEKIKALLNYDKTQNEELDNRENK